MHQSDIRRSGSVTLRNSLLISINLSFISLLADQAELRRRPVRPIFYRVMIMRKVSDVKTDWGKNLSENLYGGCGLDCDRMEVRTLILDRDNIVASRHLRMVSPGE